MSRLQKIITLFTTEAEYVTAIEACKELIWMKIFMKELGKEQVTSSLHGDSHSAINFANNLVCYEKIKHIDVRYHFIRILLKDNVLSL